MTDCLPIWNPFLSQSKKRACRSVKDTLEPSKERWQFRVKSGIRKKAFKLHIPIHYPLKLKTTLSNIISLSGQLCPHAMLALSCMSFVLFFSFSHPYHLLFPFDRFSQSTDFTGFLRLRFLRVVFILPFAKTTLSHCLHILLSLSTECSFCTLSLS